MLFPAKFIYGYSFEREKQNSLPLNFGGSLNKISLYIQI